MSDKITHGFDDENMETSVYYHLAPKKKSILQTVGYVLRNVFMIPVRAVQFILGRFLTHVIFNPLFRKHDEEVTVLAQNKKYPDPVFTDKDDLAIVDVHPKVGLFARTMINWQHGALSLLKRAFLVPVDHQSADLFIKDEDQVQQVVNQVHELIHEKKMDLEKIHLRGLHYLTPSQRKVLLDTLSKKYGHDFLDHHKKNLFYTLKTRYGDELDSVEVKSPVTAHQTMSERTFIVYCLPRSLNYTPLLNQHRYYANQLDTTLVAFNYRGTGNSKGLIASQKDMHHDVMAQVERLLALGAKPENIALMGECLGANIATHVAAECHKKKLNVKLLNIRSFRSSLMMLMGALLPEKNAKWYNPLTVGQWMMAGIAAILVTPLLYLAGWDLSIDKAFKSIPVADRDYLVVRSKKNAQGVRYRDDSNISHHYSSVYSLVKAEQERLKRKVNGGKSLNKEEQAWLADQRGSHKVHVSKALREDAPTVDGHTCQLRYLTKTKGDTGACSDAREFTIGFFRKTWGVQRVEEAVSADHVVALVPPVHVTHAVLCA
jgi:effector protein SdbA